MEISVCMYVCFFSKKMNPYTTVDPIWVHTFVRFVEIRPDTIFYLGLYVYTNCDIGLNCGDIFLTHAKMLVG